MKVIKRSASEIKKEEAHGGSGARKVYASPEHLKSTYFEAMTRGYLPAGKAFDWHDHKDIEKIIDRYFQFWPRLRSVNKAWYRYLKKHYRNVIILDWEKMFYKSARQRGEKALERVILRHKGSEIYIVSASIGAELVLTCPAIDLVKKAVLLCPVSEPVTVNNVRIMEECSAGDRWAHFGSDVLFPQNLFTETHGNKLKKVDLSCLRHKDFIPDQEITINGTKTTVGQSIVDYFNV